MCEWEISVPRGSRIHFHFAELDIEDSDCQVSYLRLHNGIGPKRSEIGETDKYTLDLNLELNLEF